MNQILYSRKNEKKAQKIAIILGALFVFAIIFSIIFALINLKSDKILRGVYIDNIYVGKATKEEATLKLDDAISNLKAEKIVLRLDDKEYEYTGKDLGVSFIDDLVDEAYEYGRSGNLISDNYTILSTYFGSKHVIDNGIMIESSKLENAIQEIEANQESSAVDDSYVIENGKLIITKGHDGVKIKEDELKSQLIKTLTDSDEIKLDVPVEIGKANRLSIEDIYDEVYVEKVDASYTSGENFEVIKEVTGISFDKEVAKVKYGEAEDNQTIEIPLIQTKPEKTVADLDDVLFKDVLGEFTTKYDQYYTNRVTNMQVAANHVNGTILYPGDEFSYNKVVGERTAARGFKDAHVYSGGKVVDGLGGGICQVSSTLYNAVLLANLEVTDRVAHMMHTGYVDPSFDATVVYGSIDFKFKNNRETPIKITVTLNKGVETVKIYGLKKADDPKVVLQSVIKSTTAYKTITEYDNTMEEGTSKVTQSPMNGYVSEGYKILKDANGKEISKTLISKDTYKPTDKIVTVGTKVVEKPVVEKPVVENPVVNPEPAEDPVTPSDEGNSGLPSGWDTPENPYYRGN